MRRAWLLPYVLILTGILCIAQQQRVSAYYQSRDSNYNLSISGASGYQGPGDIVSGATIWYSCGRAYNAAFAAGAGAICDIVDTATGLATCTIPIGTNGFANLTAVVCPTSAPVVSVTTFCTVTHATGCSVTKVYDQSGNGAHQVQATLASMPALTLSALNSLPCLTGNGSSSQMVSVTQPSFIAGSTSLVTLTNMTATPGGFNTPLGENGLTLLYTSTTAAGLYAGSAGTVAVTAAFHALMGIVASSGNSTVVVDGAGSSAASGNASATGAFIGLLAQPNNFGYIQGNVCEAAGWPVNFNSTQYGNINTNMHSATNGWNF